MKKVKGFVWYLALGGTQYMLLSCYCTPRWNGRKLALPQVTVDNGEDDDHAISLRGNTLHINHAVHQDTKRSALNAVYASPPPRFAWHHLSPYGLHLYYSHQGHHSHHLISDQHELSLPLLRWEKNWTEVNYYSSSPVPRSNLTGPMEAQFCLLAAQRGWATHFGDIGVNSLWGDTWLIKERRRGE